MDEPLDVAPIEATYFTRPETPETVTAIQLTDATVDTFITFTNGIRQTVSFLMVWVPAVSRNAFENDWAVLSSANRLGLMSQYDFRRAFVPAGR